VFIQETLSTSRTLVGGHADPRELLLEHGGDDVEHALLGIGHQLEGQRLRRAVARLGEQRPGLRLVVWAEMVDVHRFERARRGHAHPGRRLALERDLHDLLPVDAEAAHRLADPEVAEDRVGRAIRRHRLAVLRHGDLHRGQHQGRFLAGQDLGLRVLGPHRIHVVRGERGDEVDLAGLERGHLGDRVLDHPDDDLVEIGQPGLEVLVEALHQQVAALHPLHELERPAADERARLPLLAVVHSELLDGGRREKDQPGAVGREHVHEEGVGLLEADLYGQGIQHLDAVDRLVERPHPGLGGRVHHPLDVELDGGGVHRGAVVEEHVLPELERVDEAVGRGLPGVGRVAHELPIGRDIDEAAAHVHGDPHHFVAGGGVEVEVGDLVTVADAERASALRRLGQGRTGHEGEREHQSGQDEQEGSTVHQYDSFRRPGVAAMPR
jgi:hypothetical protein